MASPDNPLERLGRTARWMLWGIIVVGGLAPLILYWLCVGRLATATPPQAKELLRQEGESTLLVDVRPADEFRARHIDGAKGWPLDEILALKHRGDLPDRFRDKRLLMVCSAGVNSARATRHLAGLGVERVVNVRGGAQEWIGSAAGSKAEVFDRWRTAAGEIVEFPFHRSSWVQQLAVVIAGFVIKPIYTLLSLALAIVLWRSKAADLAALRWAMVSFFIGENCCMVNYLVFHGASYLLEYLHMFGMLLCFGSATCAVLEGVDRRILMLSAPDRKCASLSLCRRCIKYADAPGGRLEHRTFSAITRSREACFEKPRLSDTQVGAALEDALPGVAVVDSETLPQPALDEGVVLAACPSGFGAERV